MKLFHFVYDWIGTPYRFGGKLEKWYRLFGFYKTTVQRTYLI